jgi:predicted Fe-Mo cluster-binding NifX family protein
MTNRQYIAIGVDNEGRIWTGHFGIAPNYLIYDQNGQMVEQRSNPYGAGQGRKKHHDNPRLIVDLLPDCGVFIARRMGGGSKRKLAQQLGITPVLTAEEKPEAALRAYLSRPETDGP